MDEALNYYPHIREAMVEKPEFTKYIKMIWEQSHMIAMDLLSIDYILTYHDIQLVYEFMPRFISLM